ncbi:MAG: hypothetical protein HOH74_01810, partial [Gemmatimonadetes bacterium]|nr:hypothetical protein [Gemmatimonadota bacterium]
WGRNAFKLNSEYFGIVVLFLAGLFLPDIRRNRIAAAMATLFLLALFYTLGPHTPLHWIVFHLVPGASVLRTPGMAAFLFVFPACVLAAMSLDRALSGATEGLTALSSRRIAITGGILCGTAFLLGLAPDVVTGIWTSLLYPDMDPTKGAVLASSLEWIGQGAMLTALICAIAVSLLYWQTTRKMATGVIVVALCVLTIGDGWRISRRFLRYEDPAQQTDIRRENQSALRFLQKQEALGRVYEIPSYTLYEQPGYHLFDVPTVGGFHDFTIRRYDHVLRELVRVESMLAARYLKGETIPYSTADLLASIRPLLNLLAVQYLVVPSAIDPAGWGFDKALTSDRVSLLSNDTALPWCYAVPAHQVVTDENELLQMLREGRVDLRSTVLLEQEPPNTASSPSLDAQVELLERNAHDGVFRFRVKSTQPSWLVLSENFYPDWRARIDGEPTQIHRANYIWQAVQVDAGEHVVEFRFESAVLRWSRAASLASALFILVGAVILWVRRTRTATSTTSEVEPS